MATTENNRCLGRIKARELTEEEITLVSGGEDHQHGRYHVDGPIVVEGDMNDYCIGGMYT